MEPDGSSIGGEWHTLWAPLVDELACAVIRKWHGLPSKWLNALNKSAELLRSDGKRPALVMRIIAYPILALSLIIDGNVYAGPAGQSHLDAVHL
jgi:hypothetical protein